VSPTPDDRCIRRWLGAGSWNDALRRAHLERLTDGDVVVFPHGRIYLAEEAKAALLDCAADLGHVPSYPEYMAWTNRPDVRRRPGRRPKSFGASRTPRRQLRQRAPGRRAHLR
jgi:hypothetical protein